MLSLANTTTSCPLKEARYPQPHGKNVTRTQGGCSVKLGLIYKAWLREEKVRKPKGFVLDEYLANGGLGFGTGKMKKLKAVFTKAAGEHLY